jgi:uncharacterized protein (DUF486 family)
MEHLLLAVYSDISNKVIESIIWTFTIYATLKKIKDSILRVVLTSVGICAVVQIGNSSIAQCSQGW